MAGKDTIDSFVRNLGQSIGVEMSLDGDGRCGVACKDGLECLIFAVPDSELVLFEAVVADPVGTEDHEVFRKALEANLSEAVGLGAIGFDPAEGVLLFRHTFQTDGMEQTEFENTFGAFILSGQALRARLGGSNDETGPHQMQGQAASKAAGENFLTPDKFA